MIKIKKAVQASDFSVNKVYEKANILSTPLHATNSDGCTVYQTELDITAGNFHECSTDGHNYYDCSSTKLSEAQTNKVYDVVYYTNKSFQNIYWEYKSTTTPLNWIRVDNPDSFGVNLAELSIPQQFNQRCLIASGKLSGCHFGILIRNSQVLILHVGVNGTKSTTPLMNNAMILKACLTFHNLGDCYTVKDNITTEELVKNLASLGYEGVLAVKDMATKRDNKLFAIQYDNCAYVSAFINREHILAINIMQTQTSGEILPSTKQYRFWLSD